MMENFSGHGSRCTFVRVIALISLGTILLATPIVDLSKKRAMPESTAGRVHLAITVFH